MSRLADLPPVARAILSILSAVALFSAMNASIKWLGGRYPISQIIFCRALFAMLVLTPLIWRAGGIMSLRTSRPLGHLARSAIGVISMLCGFTAITLLPLANASALAFTAPLWTTLLGVLVLGEKVRWRRTLALIIGFSGVLVILRPDASLVEGILAGGPQAVGSLLGLCSSFLAACAMISVRRLSSTEPSTTIVFYFMASGMVVSAILMSREFVMPTAHDAMLMVLLGVIGGLAQILLTTAYRSAPVAVVAPFDYTAMLWATGYGFVIWGEVPHPAVALGALIVIGSGVYITLRETRLGKPAPTTAQSTTKNN
ncbi:DMT family transporter [Niveispirillum sp. KHB5.9]|uniref:DMT family transporter n=1 Tax=Niveispirillum sp. KHB5.9 TaxID=3400269 RepID=UPI003A84F769